jgi:hypothetical protein
VQLLLPPPLLQLPRNMLVLFVEIKHQANIMECTGLFVDKIMKENF